MVSERSIGSLLMALVAIGLIVAALAFPWFTYAHSSGRQTPVGGYHDEADTGVERRSMEAQPGGYSGDVEPTEPERAQQVLDWTAWALYAAMGALVLLALGEIPGLSRVLVRPLGLAFSALAMAAITTAALLVWFAFPDTMSGYGVKDPFTSYLDDDEGYTMTTLRVGWVLGALSFPAAFGAFLFKFQAGASDATAVAEFAARGEL